MSKQALPTPKTSRTVDQDAEPRASSATSKKRYQPGRDRRSDSRLTANFEGHRDNKPIIFGYGRNLRPAEKTRLQRRMYFIFAGVMVAAVVGVLVFGWVNFNFIQPQQPIVTVDGVNIPQRDYKLMVAYLAQDTWNKLQQQDVQQQNLQKQLAAEKDANKTKDLQTQLSAVQAQISSYQSAFSQTQLDSLAVNDLVENQLIIQGAKDIAKTDPSVTGKIAVTDKQVTDALNAFKTAFPSGQSLKDFENKNGFSQDDIKHALTIILRRNAMDQYQQSLLVSPEKQVHVERIQYDTQAKAQADYAKLVKDPTQWNALAKADSLDSTTKDSGGDLGWVVRGQQDQAIERFAFSAKAGDMSGVMKDISGTWEIARVLEIDNSRTVSADVISSLKSNALSHWLDGERNLAPTKISQTNQDMFDSPNNVATTPNTNVTFPSSSTDGSTGGSTLPGSTNP